MANIDTSLHKAPAASGRPRILRIFAASAAAASAAAAPILLEGQNLSLALAALAAFAAGGAFAALAWACGLLTFGKPPEPNNLPMHILGASPDPIVVTHADGRVMFANRAYRAITGCGEGDPPPPDKIIQACAGSPERAFQLMRSARQGRGWREEFRGPAPGWPMPYFEVAAWPAPRREGDKNSPVMAWRISDVSKSREREAEALARMSVAHFSLQTMGIGLFTAGPDGGLRFVNDAAAVLLGISRANAQSLRLADIVSKASAGFLKNLDFSQASASAQLLDADFVSRDGAVIPVRLFYKIAAMPGETGLSFVAMALNQLEPPFAALPGEAEAQSRFMKLFDAAPIAMGRVARGGGLSMVNASLFNLLGLEGGAPSGQINVLDLVDEPSRSPLAAAIGKALARKADIPPAPFTLAGDCKRTGRFYLSPAAGAKKADASAILFGVDASAQRALEEQVAQSQKMQAVGQLAGGVAHDFNNLLTAIIGFSDLLLAKHRPADPAFKDIMNIKHSANRAAALVRQLLAFSSRQTLRPRVLLLTDVLEDTTLLLARLLGEKITTKVLHGRDLWQVKADFNQLEQVIVNLAVNARDAMGGEGELTLRTANISERESFKLGPHGLASGEYVLCEVSDTGSGIPPGIIEKIFEPFFSTKEVGKGTGLGLSTVYGIVKQTGGHIAVESQPGAGAIFRIYLPRYIETEADKAAAAKAAKAAKKEKPRDLTGTGAVLLVEDEDAVRSFASRALTTRGYKVYEAASGVGALEVMKAHGGEIGLVISDVVMPEMDGPALLKRLREDHPGIKFIFISGYAEEAFKGSIRDNDQFAFLPKPFSLRQLAEAVKEQFVKPH